MSQVLGKSRLNVDSDALDAEGDFCGGSPTAASISRVRQVGALRLPVEVDYTYFHCISAAGSKLVIGLPDGQISLSLAQADIDAATRASDAVAVSVAKVDVQYEGQRHAITAPGRSKPSLLLRADQVHPSRSWRWAALKVPAGYWAVHDLSSDTVVEGRSDSSTCWAAAAGSDSFAAVTDRSISGMEKLERYELRIGGISDLRMMVPWKSLPMTFSADDSVLFVGHPDGRLEALCTATGESLGDVGTGPKIMGMRCFGGLLWVLRDGWRLEAYGVEGEPWTPPAGVPLALLEEQPDLRSWVVVPELPPLPSRNLGGRVLRAVVVDGEPLVMEEPDEILTKIKKKPGDNADDLSIFRKAWKDASKGYADALRRNRMAAVETQLRRSVPVGQTVDGAVLASELASAHGFAYEGSVWETVAGDQHAIAVLHSDACTLAGADGEQVQPLAGRWRLVHRSRFEGGAVPTWMLAGGHAWQFADRLWLAEDSEETILFPVDTDNARTPTSFAMATLSNRGFVHNPFIRQPPGQALDLAAPELGAIARVFVDEEHGGCGLSFVQWDGSVLGGEPLSARDVHPQLFSEAVQIAVNAHPKDPKSTIAYVA